MSRTATDGTRPASRARRQTLVGVFWMIVTGFCFRRGDGQREDGGRRRAGGAGGVPALRAGAVFLLPMIPAVRAVPFHAADPEAGGLRGVAMRWA
jgi:hypothetical protein